MRHDLILPTILSLLLAPIDALALSCDEPYTRLECVVLGLEQVDIPCMSLTQGDPSYYLLAKYTCEDEAFNSLFLNKSDLDGEISFYLKSNKEESIRVYDTGGEQRTITLQWRRQTPQETTEGVHQLQYSCVIETNSEGDDVCGSDVAFFCASPPASAPHTPSVAALIALTIWRHRRRHP